MPPLIGFWLCCQLRCLNCCDGCVPFYSIPQPRTIDKDTILHVRDIDGFVLQCRLKSECFCVCDLVFDVNVLEALKNCRYDKYLRALGGSKLILISVYLPHHGPFSRVWNPSGLFSPSLVLTNKMKSHSVMWQVPCISQLVIDDVCIYVCKESRPVLT